MSDRPAQGLQLETIPFFAPQVQESFDLNRLEAFVTGLGVDWIHYAAMPSPIGKNDRGSLRRNDGVDTITSNGMIYTPVGQFTACMTDNSRESKQGAAGVLDPSESRLVMPSHYNNLGVQTCGGDGVAQGGRIYLMPGDRLYIADPNADVLVATAQEIDYQPDVDNETFYPVVTMQKLVDSRNIQYTLGVDFTITPQGNIRWIDGGNNPGIDPATGKGRIYSVRYLYKAYYYVVALPKEVRVTNVTVGSERGPVRMPYYAILVREYIFHNKNRGDKMNGNAKVTPRTDAAPEQTIGTNEFAINVDMTTVAREED